MPYAWNSTVRNGIDKELSQPLSKAWNSLATEGMKLKLHFP